MPLLLLLPLQAQAPSSEARRLDQTIEAMQAVKQRLNELQTEVDGLLRLLSEHKGALTAQPAPFGGPAATAAAVIEPDKPRPVSRCAALTKDGSRCTRAALPGARYCRQHGLAR
jgi:hypothetical protein